MDLYFRPMVPPCLYEKEGVTPVNDPVHLVVSSQGTDTTTRGRQVPLTST